MLKLMVWGIGAFGRWLVHKARAVMSGIIAIMKEVQEALLPSSIMGGYDGKIAASEEHGFYPTDSVSMISSMILNFWDSETLSN